MTAHTKHDYRPNRGQCNQRQPESAFEAAAVIAEESAATGEKMAATMVPQGATMRQWLWRRPSGGRSLRRLSQGVPLRVMSALLGLVVLLLIQGCVSARYDVRVAADGTADVSLDMAFNERLVALAGSCEQVTEPLTASAAGIPGSEFTLDSDDGECHATLAWNDLAPGNPLLTLLGVSGSADSGWQFTLPAAPEESPGSGGAEGEFGTEGMEDFELVVTAELPGESDANNAHEVTTEGDATVFVWRFEGLEGAIEMSSTMPTGATKPAAESDDSVTTTTVVDSGTTEEDMDDEDMAEEEIPPTTTAEAAEDMVDEEATTTTTEAAEDTVDEEATTTTTEESSDDGGSGSATVLIVIAALVVIGGAAFLLIRRRSSK